MRHTVVMGILLGLGGCSVPAQHFPPPSAGDGVTADAAAEAGMLTFSSDRPLPGQRVEATYHSSKALTGEPRLHLRARLRTPEHDDYNDGMGSRTVAVLEKQRDGTFLGSFSLPADVVYAAFAVEDVAATRTDSREGRFWEVLVHDAAGRPLFETLKQRCNDHMGRNELAVLETAREMVRLYPENPTGWSILHAAEGFILGEQAAEVRMAEHRERLNAFDRALAEKRDLSADEVGAIYWYALSLRDEELAARWRERLIAEYPGHYFVGQERVMELAREHREDPAALLHELEELWTRADSRRFRERIIGPAFTAARQVRGGTVLVWADRSVQTKPASRVSVATTLASTEATREEGIRRLQDEVSRMEQFPDEERPLGATVAEHRETTAHRAAALRTSFGGALLAAGRTREGIAALEQAATVGWNTSRFRSLGDAWLSDGNREGAIPAFAAVAADPATSTETSDSLRLELGLEPAPWEAAVSRARIKMLERTLQSARAETLPSVNVVIRNGSPARLEELIGDEASVVVFWSRYCGFSVEAMPRIAALAERFAQEPVRLLAVTRDSPAQAEPYLQEGEWNIQVLFDTEGEAARALNSWGTPQYFVLDGAGRLRFAFSSLNDLPRQLAALRGQESRSE
jgi:peroxiredoxin